MTQLELDWSTAEVSDGKLTVSLDGKPGDDWSASFQRTAALLDRGTWPDVKLKKREITVKGVEDGSEESLRFFLESVVQEANAETANEDEEADRPEPESQADESRSAEDPDREMTERFRSFAGSEPEPGLDR